MESWVWRLFFTVYSFAQERACWFISFGHLRAERLTAGAPAPGSQMKIGFIGLGQMGAGMVANLLKAGYEVAVYNRTAGKAEALVRLGAKAQRSVEAVCAADAVITMLSDDEAVESVVFGKAGVLASLPKGAAHISSSTISVAMSKRLAAAHAGLAQDYLAAPVFGRPDAAANGKLFVVVGGPARLIDRIYAAFQRHGAENLCDVGQAGGCESGEIERQFSHCGGDRVAR